MELSGRTFLPFASVGHWLEASDGVSASVVLFCADAGWKHENTQHEIMPLLQSTSHPSVIVVSDDGDLDQIVEMLGQGVRGYIPTSAPLSEVMAAVRLVEAGGVFVPADSLKAAWRSAASTGASNPTPRGGVTPRQDAVLRLLGQGKPNKIIAYELCMAESTVKVHVRNMMKKFRAMNRTHLAFLANQATGVGGTVGLRREPETSQGVLHGGRRGAGPLLAA